MKDIGQSFQILGSRCLVKELKESAETDSGIVIPGQDKAQTNKGIVIAVGDGAILESGEKIPVKVTVGDNVLYSSFSGSPIKVKKDDPDNYFILNERDILCIYKA